MSFMGVAMCVCICFSNYMANCIGNCRKFRLSAVDDEQDLIKDVVASGEGSAQDCASAYASSKALCTP